MGCINCHADIDITALLCPFCHTDPTEYGGQPYPQQPECEPAPLLAGCLIGGLVATVFPWVGLTIACFGVVQKLRMTGWMTDGLFTKHED